MTKIPGDNSTIIEQIFKRVKGHRIIISNEKDVQAQIDYQLKSLGFQREHVLSSGMIDLFYNGIGIEIKIKGNKMSIYRQCERYCLDDEITHFILITNRAMGFPETINDKPCYVINISEAWL